MADNISNAAMSHNGLTSSITTWTSLSEKDKLSWDGTSCRNTLRKALTPAIHGYGAVRLLLLDRPEEHSLEALKHLLLSLSRQVGYVIPQTHENNLIGQIQDEGKDYRLPATRGHKTNSELRFHSDRSDLIFLFYVRPAQVGGDLSVVSYNEAARLLATEAPEVLKALFMDFPFDLRDERIFQEQEWCQHPIMWHRRKEVRGHYIQRFILDSQRHADCPRLTAAQHAALSTFEAVLEKLRPSRTFKPTAGELVVLNNYRVLHARKSFSDDGRPGTGRLAIRTWVAPYESEELPGFMLPISGAVTPGCFRGGVGRGNAYLSSLGSTFPQPLDGPAQ